MTTVRTDGIFGRQAPAHTIIIARGDKVRHFTIRPFALAAASTIVSALVAGCFGVGAYHVMRDDILASGTFQQTRLERAYEERIASLRAQLDRVTSRQLLDRQTVETKVETLLGQQVELVERYEKLGPLLDRARTSGLMPDAVPIPRPKPASAAEEESPLVVGPEALAFGSEPQTPVDRFSIVDRSSDVPESAGLSAWRLTPDASAPSAREVVSPSVIQEIGRSLGTVEERQIDGLFGLALSARARAAGIQSALRSEGIRMPEAEASSTEAAVQGSGGPFVPVLHDGSFDARLAELEDALGELDAVHDAASHLPLDAPLATAPVSSSFGVRRDPFLGRSAMHTGVDFVALNGTRVEAGAPGIVVAAGPSGGYGNMVELDHGGGVTTRYAHLSTIRVAIGDRLATGDAIGSVGSTGRSTGAHLHYEIRRDGNAVDPTRFLRAGRKIAALG